MIRPISNELLQQIVEAALIAANKPLSVQALQQLFDDEERPSKAHIQEALLGINDKNQDRGFEVVEVASGWRFQVRQKLSPWVSRLWEERPQKYSRALLETLSLVAYRQPITRGDIESIRGVAVSSNIMRTLVDRGWVKVVGHRDVPGRPAMYASTREFLDYFNLKSLEDLPTLAEIRDLESLNQELNLQHADTQDAAQMAAEERNSRLQVDVEEPERQPVQDELIPLNEVSDESDADANEESVDAIASAVEEAELTGEEAKPVESANDILNAVASMDVDDAFAEDNKETRLVSAKDVFASVAQVAKESDTEDDHVSDFNSDALVHYSDDIDPAFLDEEDNN